MTLREIISRLQGEEIIDSNSISSEILDYQVNIYDIDLHKNLEIDPEIRRDDENSQITIKVEG